MTRVKFSSLALIAVLATSLGACTTASKRLGLTKSTPNEFNILTKPPLVVPPEYNLRPPQLGVASAENNYTQQAARLAVLGEADPAEPSTGEALFLQDAGFRSTDPEVRLRIDGNNAVERKVGGFADEVLFWRDGKAVKPDGSPLNPELEAERLKRIQAATGGGEVTITKRPARPKLPGL